MRVLFFAEPATLAHVARPAVLARELAVRGFEVTVATGGDFRWVVEQAEINLANMRAIGTRAYLNAVTKGRPVFPLDVLQSYVLEDLRLIGKYQPDVVIGDMRLSLALSARVAGVRFLAIANAYWSPLAPTHFEVPVHRLTRGLGYHLVKWAFPLAWPIISAIHALPMYRLCKRYGVPPLGLDLRRVFTEGDTTLFADVPSMVPTTDCSIPGRYEYIGPVVWSADGALPAELDEEDDLRPLVYVALGSSGDSSLLGAIVEALLVLNCRVAVSTGREGMSSFPKGVVAAKFFPGEKLAARARVVVCNGGSPSTHQALLAGTPVLGVPENLDQILNMQFVVASGAGLALRADRLSPACLASLVGRLLTDDSFRQAASRVSLELRSVHCGARVAEILCPPVA